jgi:hypothetical protein
MYLSKLNKMTTIKLFPDWMKQFFNCQLSNLKLPSFFATLGCLLVSFLLQLNTVSAQVTVCPNCTANDVDVQSVELVQLNPAWASDHTQPKYLSLPAVCSGSETVTGYLKITISQNATTRYGLSVDGDILKDGTYSSSFQYCDPSETTSGGFIVYVENAPILWTCGTKLELRNLFVGWGNSSGSNACSATANCDLKPHCAQFPLHGEPPIIIITPLSADFSSTGSCTTGKTAQTYSFNALDAINGTTGGTPPYPSNAYSWTIVNKSTSVQIGTMTGSNPSFDFSQAGAGTGDYTITLTVTDDNPTAISSTSHDITVISCCTHNANAGTNGTLTVCAGTTPTDAQLFAALGGSPDAGGSWSNVGNVYTYTVVATAPCTGNATATVTVSTQAAPNAGTDGTLTICAGTTPTETQLFAVIGTHDAGGSWSNVGNVYTYTVPATTPCTGNATATVTVSTQTTPNAGTSGTLTVCAGTTPTETQLFAVIGAHDAGGSWSNVSNVYTYTVVATAPCTGNATANVTVTTQAAPNAGTNGTLSICTGTTPTNAQLFAQLGGTPDAGGSWSHIGNVYTYTVGATAPCTAAATATVTVTVNPNALCAQYSGDYFANTASTTTGGSAVVTLKYNISGTGTCNNISGLVVGDFKITYVSDPSIGSVQIVAGYPTYIGGVFTTKYTITLSPSAYSGTVQFTLGLNNNNYSISGDCSDNPLVTVSTKVTGFVTGGGFIIPTNSGGTIGGISVNGLRNNFGFNIKSGKKLQGTWNTIIRRMENGHIVSYQVKSNTAATLVVTKITATSWRADMSFTSANFQNLTCPLCPVGANNGTVLVSVYDNGEPGAGVDKILITIKDHSGNVWYTSDKAATNSITYTNLQLLNQGNIQIHTTGGAFALSTNTQISQTTASSLSVSAYPNPFTDNVRFSIISPVSGKASLDIYNSMGQKLHTVYQGYIFAGRGQVIEYNVPSTFKGGLIYTLKVGNQQVNGKVIRIK